MSATNVSISMCPQKHVLICHGLYAGLGRFLFANIELNCSSEFISFTLTKVKNSRKLSLLNAKLLKLEAVVFSIKGLKFLGDKTKEKKTQLYGSWLITHSYLSTQKANNH